MESLRAKLDAMGEFIAQAEVLAEKVDRLILEADQRLRDMIVDKEKDRELKEAMEEEEKLVKFLKSKDEESTLNKMEAEALKRAYDDAVKSQSI
jgi:acetyl-CoA carboxylase beta subunit